MKASLGLGVCAASHSLVVMILSDIVIGVSIVDLKRRQRVR